jgi:hypothetical protein
VVTSEQLGQLMGAELGGGEPSTDGSRDVCTFRRDGAEPVVVTRFGPDGSAALDEAERSPSRVQIATGGLYAIVTESSNLWLRGDDVVVRISTGDATSMSQLSSIANAVRLPGGESTGSTSGGTEAGGCELLSPADVEGIVGGSVTVEPMSRDYLAQMGAGFAGGCQYFADEMVNLFVYAEGSAQSAIDDVELQGGEGGLTVTDLSDVGDEAVLYRRETDLATYVVARKGERGVWLQVTAAEDQAIELVRRAVGRL